MRCSTLGFLLLTLFPYSSNQSEEIDNPRLHKETLARIPGGSKHLIRRHKRSIQGTEETQLRLEFSSPFLKRHASLNLRLSPRSPTSLVSPHYKLIVREGNQSYAYGNERLSRACLFSGSVTGLPRSSLALSNCDEGKLSGILHLDQRDFTFESLPSNRAKRHAGDDLGAEDEVLLIMERLNPSNAHCGLNSKNKRRFMAAGLRDSFSLRWEEVGNHSRHKRQARGKKAIELAVFVDDELHSNVQNSLESDQRTPDNILIKIQNIVFTYLNSVQLLYESTRLSTTFELILVRLEVARSPISGLKKHRNIEKYLLSFCSWQKSINPGGIFFGDLNTPDHWDHGLLLTGLNMYDSYPENDNVIGLAWVSGMCHPSFSCTINEGNNFESVYVIAHEMGHSLGMNHDGELDEGNTCRPDKYLMSPILGPGRVTWSSCSNQEIEDFLNERQASCLNDLPEAQEDYDYAKAQEYKYPGELYSAMDQCIQAFGKPFKPYLRELRPYENICRELWCKNRTHALRAHPALEGTDCHHKPFPFGSICQDGLCTPFDSSRRKDQLASNRVQPMDLDETLIDGRPAWFDPLFTDIFHELKLRYSAELNSGPEEISTM